MFSLKTIKSTQIRYRWWFRNPKQPLGMYKTSKNHGINYRSLNLNWLAGFLNHQQYVLPLDYAHQNFTQVASSSSSPCLKTRNDPAVFFSPLELAKIDVLSVFRMDFSYIFIYIYMYMIVIMNEFRISSEFNLYIDIWLRWACYKNLELLI